METQWPVEHNSGHQGSQSPAEERDKEIMSAWCFQGGCTLEGGNIWFYMKIKKILGSDLGKAKLDILIKFMVFSIQG